MHTTRYDTFHWKRSTPTIHQIEKLRFLSIAWCKFRLRFWLGARRQKGFSPPPSGQVPTHAEKNPGVYLSGGRSTGIWGKIVCHTLIWTYPDGARQLRRSAPRRRAPNWICTEKFDFLDLVDLGGVAFSVETVIELHCQTKFLKSYLSSHLI